VGFVVFYDICISVVVVNGSGIGKKSGILGIEGLGTKSEFLTGEAEEIAELMSLSPETIYINRKNIRKKFGLENKKTNLRSLLLLIY